MNTALLIKILEDRLDRDAPVDLTLSIKIDAATADRIEGFLDEDCREDVPDAVTVCA